jgi:hypothetical protein
LHFPAFLPLQSGFSSGFYSPRAKNVRMTRRAGIARAKGQTLSVPPDYNQEKKVHQGVCAATAPLAALLDKRQ